MTTPTRLSEAEMRARALARWESEGGALAPSGLQDTLVVRAAKLGVPGDHARVKENLARFLREHRDQC